MRINTEVISLGNGVILLTATEADGSFDAKVAVKKSDADKIKSDDKTLIHFAKVYYPILYACTRGDVPNVEDVYKMNGESLDRWYQTIQDLNPDLIVSVSQEYATEEIEFRDGTVITVHATRDLPSYMLSLHRHEQAIEDTPPEDLGLLSFGLTVYSKLAACSTGESIPSLQEAYEFPRSELSKWITAAAKLNPQWFDYLLEMGKQAIEDEQKQKVKKKRRNRKTNR